MSLLPPPFDKYDFSGIGNASATAVMALLLANPGTTFLATGVLGKIIYLVLSKIFSALASFGLVILNVGAEQIATAVEKSGFDGSFSNAYTLIDQLNSTGHGLTSEQVTAIDAPVISAFEKFAKLTRTKS